MQTLIGMRCFDRIQILALDILDERELEHLWFSNVLDDDGHLGEPGELRSTPAALPGDDLIGIAAASNNQRLNDPVGANGCCQLLESVRLEDCPGLHRIWLD